ncbi:MAG: tetratricopeptide repeat protein [Proteobacteria bacterium]|nr:tetratricopeptide repeat protein [Pseudomonadota bacterium]MBU1595988.1 tetratricopeptide repeat protein [Pseudomonadota bacterium]
MSEEPKYNNVDEYIQHLKEQLMANAECGNTHYNLGVAYLSKREFMDAERCFREAVANSPKMAEAYVQMGGICLERGDLEGCLSFNRLAAQQRPFFAVPWGNIGFVLLQLGDSEKAIPALQKAIKYDPTFVQALATLGSAHFSRGEMDDALVNLKKAVELQPKFGPAWNNLALVQAELGSWAEAAESVKMAQASGYDVPQVLLDEIAAKLK